MRIRNPRVFILSLLGLASIILTFTVSGYFIIAAVIFSILGWRDLYKEKR